MCGSSHTRATVCPLEDGHLLQTPALHSSQSPSVLLQASPVRGLEFVHVDEAWEQRLKLGQPVHHDLSAHALACGSLAVIREHRLLKVVSSRYSGEAHASTPTSSRAAAHTSTISAVSRLLLLDSNSEAGIACGQGGLSHAENTLPGEHPPLACGLSSAYSWDIVMASWASTHRRTSAACWSHAGQHNSDLHEQCWSPPPDTPSLCVHLLPWGSLAHCRVVCRGIHGRGVAVLCSPHRAQGAQYEA